MQMGLVCYFVIYYRGDIFIEMKQNLTDEIRSIIAQSREWVKLEVEYAKFTTAEKVTMLMSALIIGAVCLLLGVVVLIMLAFALVEVFKLFMAPGLAYLSVGGVICLLILILYLCKKPLLIDPVARLISKIFFDKY